MSIALSVQVEYRRISNPATASAQQTHSSRAPNDDRTLITEAAQLTLLSLLASGFRPGCSCEPHPARVPHPCDVKGQKVEFVGTACSICNRMVDERADPRE